MGAGWGGAGEGVLLQAGPAGKDRKAGNNVLIVIPGVHITPAFSQQSASASNQESDGTIGAPG